MSNIKTLTTITVAVLFTASAMAQDAETSPIIEAVTTLATGDFRSSDLDQDGSLNADEFVSFAVMRAEAGDEALKDVVISGEYLARFVAQDADASGSIELSEIADATPETAEPVEVTPKADVPVGSEIE